MGYRNLFFLLRKKPLIGLAATTVLAVSGYTYYQHSYYSDYPSNLYAVLDYYEFTSPEQKQALRYLMQKAGIKNTDALLNHKAENQAALSRLILEFVKETQDKFTIRTGKQERWEVQISDWMKDKEQQNQILAALKTLKMTDTILPKFNKPDLIAILGASKKIMVLRLKYVEDLFVGNKLPAKWLVLLTGERYVTPDQNGIKIDGSEQELRKLANRLGKDISKLTETDLMIAAYKLCPLPKAIIVFIRSAPHLSFSDLWYRFKLLIFCSLNLKFFINLFHHKKLDYTKNHLKLLYSNHV